MRPRTCTLTPKFQKMKKTTTINNRGVRFTHNRNHHFNMISLLSTSIIAFSLYSSGSIAFGFAPRHSGRIIRRPQQHTRDDDVLTSSSSLSLSSTTSSQITNNDTSSNNSISKTVPSGISWEVFVSLANQSNKDKGSVLSVSAIMESFTSFSPSPGVITAHTAIFHKQSNNKVLGKGKGHLVRCIQKKDELTLSAIEVNNVDSIEKVYRIVTEHMRLTSVPPKACDCIKCYFNGNDSLEEGDTTKAIEMYNEALSLADKRTRQSSQIPKGMILMKRSRAYLQRAANHRQILKSLVKELVDIVPSTSTMPMRAA